MSVISKKTAGLFLYLGLFLILTYAIFFSQSFLTDLILFFALLLIIIFFWKPEWGLLTILIIRPSIDQFSENYSIDLAENFTFNISAILGVLLVLLSVIFFIKNRNLVKNIPLKKIWLIYIAAVSISIFFSIQKIFGIYETIRVISIFSIFSLAGVMFLEEKNRKKILVAILISSVIPLLFSFYQLFASSGLGGTLGIESRLYGTFSHPNSFASFVLIILAMAVYFLFKKDILNRKLFYLIASIALFIIFETFSRGAWIAVFVFFLTLSIFKSKKIILVGIFLFAFLLIISETARERMQDVYNPPATSSVVWRFEQWKKMYSLFKENPLTGYGAGNETVVFEKEFGFYAGNPYTHNDFLRAGVETGIGGMISFALLILAPIFYLFRNFLSSNDAWEKTSIVIILALFMAEIWFSLTSNIFRGTATQWALWALLAAHLGIKGKSNSPELHQPSVEK